MHKIIKSFLDNKNPPLPKLIVLLGPTASGKTALSLKVAKKINGEIISADSRQIYKEMDIATDKISQKDQQNIPHHLIDFINPDKDFTVAHFKRLAVKKIREIIKRGKTPLLVGGTGLYIDAVTKNFIIPKVKPDWRLREKLKKEFNKKGGKYLLKKLAKLDPSAAAKIDYHNHRYLIRALEINLTKKKTKEDKTGKPLFNVLKIGINRPRNILHHRIGERVEAQIKKGLIEETKKIVAKYGRKFPSFTSLGYPQIMKYLDGELTLEQAKELLKAKTRQYAKRQITWFKRDKNIIWVEK